MGNSSESKVCKSEKLKNIKPDDQNKEIAQ